MRRVYDHAWRKVRALVLARDNYQCKVRGPRCTGHANHVDHIVTIANGGPRLDPTNLRASCATCNIGRRVERIVDHTAGAGPSRIW